MHCIPSWIRRSRRRGIFLGAARSLVAAPRERNTDFEKAQIKAGQTAADIWPDKPAKAKPKDVDGRWAVKYSREKTRTDGSRPIDIVIPVNDYKNHISIDSMNGLIRRRVSPTRSNTTAPACAKD